MTSAAFRASSRVASAAWMATIALVLGGVLVACGGGGIVPYPGVQTRALDPSFATRKAVAYSPYRTSVAPGSVPAPTVTTAQIDQDLSLLAQGGFGLIRLFDCQTNASQPSGGSAETILQRIQANNLDIKVQLGIYIQGGNDSYNQAQIARAIQLANTYSASVLAVSVGNENMVSWSFNPVAPATMADYINKVRSGVTQPVTADDNWLFFSGTDRNNPNVVLNAIDFVSMHTYALIDTVTSPGSWDWQQSSVPADARAAAMMNASIAWSQTNYNSVRSYLDGAGYRNLPITIGETGWKAVVTDGETQRAGPINQWMYYQGLTAWSASTTLSSKPLAIFYFEAFDEPWKGSDDGWGLFNVGRQARCVVQGRYPNSLWVPGQDCTLANALYYIPVAGNPTITANRFTVYANTAVTGEAQPTEAISWVGFNSPATAFAGSDTTSFAPGDGPNSLQITPAPQNASPMFGWGMIALLPTTSDDMSNFVASGRLNFSIKSTYPGKIQVGFLTGSTTANTAVQAYIVIDPSTAQYGYVNDGTWRAVSIPISAIIANATPAYGQPASATLNMAQVTQPFTIADLYASTGKSTTAQGVGNTTTFNIDDIYWSK
jgi:exo-beta-1,3-glucanase (GH17 family)